MTYVDVHGKRRGLCKKSERDGYEGPEFRSLVYEGERGMMCGYCDHPPGCHDELLDKVMIRSSKLFNFYYCLLIHFW